MADEQRELTWQRLLDPASQMKGLVAENGGQIIGFAHYVFHLAAWVKHQSCYLQDLCVSSSIRGKGRELCGNPLFDILKWGVPRTS